MGRHPAEVGQRFVMDMDDAAVAHLHHGIDRLLGLANDVGLLAEEYDVHQDRMVGNFPQAFSHVALVNTALNLTRATGPAEKRSDA